MLVRDRYDDGGFSGGTLERPALKRLLADIEAGLVDVVVVYKIDRLSRSLMDFSKLVEVFDATGVTFVSVTQSFNTTTSMGRLTLNILLSFAQFEREVIGERIRDKFAASRKKGMWMGGWRAARLRREGPQAGRQRSPRQRSSARSSSGSCSVGSATMLAQRAAGRRRADDQRARPIDKGYLYKLLNNRIYIGDGRPQGHRLSRRARSRSSRRSSGTRSMPSSRRRPHAAARTRAQTPALLKGLLFGPTGAAMSPTHTRKGNRLYRYYVSQAVLKHGRDACPVGRVPAAEIEAVVIDQLRGVFRQPEIIVGTWRAARKEASDVSEAEVRGA